MIKKYGMMNYDYLYKNIWISKVNLGKFHLLTVSLSLCYASDKDDNLIPNNITG